MRRNFRTYEIAVAFYRLSRAVPLPRHLRDQLNCSASSVVLNLAEGSGRSSKKEQKRFFEIAFGSLRESQAVLDLSIAEVGEAVECADKLAAHLYRLIQRVAEAA